MPQRMLIIIVLLLTLAPARAQELTVSAAISLKEALTEIAETYQRDSGKVVRLNLGATGPLLAQIREGAPVDVFISAADAHMDQAEKLKLIDPATRSIIASNQLVLIVPAGAASPLRGFADLAEPTVKRIAIGEPKNVPAGTYAMQVLRHLKIADALSSRIVAGANVRQVLDYVERGEVDAGFVYATDAKQAGDKVRVIAHAEPTWHDPIRYPAAVVAASRQRDAAKAFIEYLSDKPAQAVLRRKGFAPPTTQASTPAER